MNPTTSGLKRQVASAMTADVMFGGERPIEITDPMLGRQVFVPDQSTAFVKFKLAHSYPVVVQGTTTHPAVVARCFQSLRYKVFNLAHIMRAYNPKEFPRDRILGMIVAVEYPPTPAGGWQVGTDKASAPAITAVAAIIKSAEGVADILDTYQRGTTPWGGRWAVSQENYHFIEHSGFLVKGTDGLDGRAWDTPADFAALGYTYVPVPDAPLELLRCLNDEEDDAQDGDASTRVKRRFRDQETLFLNGGMESVIHFSGTGLTPFPKEKEAVVAAFLASGKLNEIGGLLVPDLLAPMREILQLADAFCEPRGGGV